jgi:hypothetical protein
MQTSKPDTQFEIVLNDELAQKFAKVLNDQSLMFASFVAHNANNTANLEYFPDPEE